MIRLLLAASIYVCAGLPAAADQHTAEVWLKTVIAGDHRTPKYAARDKYRHPFETLKFFGIRPDQNVVE
ncbi:MAG: methyltransferase, partial [Gammaproteobacteria bacterium]